MGSERVTTRAGVILDPLVVEFWNWWSDLLESRAGQDLQLDALEDVKA